MDEIVHYEAETCHTGGYLCGHHHRTPEAARRCLPTLPRRGSSLAGIKIVTCYASDRCLCTLPRTRAEDTTDEE